jgi:tetratricopeptide (TPR) repeat protein/DNA-binding CsgD family transcriptional regulator
MVRAILRVERPVPGDIVHLLHHLTDGNPFFLEEALKSLVELGDLSYADGRWNRKPLEALRVPRTVRDAVQRRTAHLSAAAHQVLTTAAVTGQRFDFALLRVLTRVGEAELLALIRELISHQLVLEESADRFAFRHALTREAVYSDLLARERRQLHGDVAEAMEALSPDGFEASVADLAYHFSAAKVWDKALTYSQEAGEQALAVYAPRAAVEHFTRALSASEQLAVTAPPALYQGRGSAYELIGDFERARVDYETARQRARAADDRRAEWQALLSLALLWAGRDYARVGDFIQSALQIAREMGDPAALAHSLNRLGNWYTNVERPREGLQCHREALEVFEQLGDRRGIAETLDFLGMTGNIASDHAQSAAHYARAIPLLEEIDDRQRLVTSLTIWMLQSGFYLSETAVSAPLSVAEAESRGERALAIAREMDWPAGEAFVLYELALWLGPRGRYAPAFESAQRALALAEEIGHQQWLGGALCALGALYLDLLDASAARQHLERALALAREISSPIWMPIATSFLVPAYLLQGDLDRAASVLDASLEGEASMETIMQRLWWRARAQLALAQREAGRALEIVDRLTASAAPVPGQGVVPGLLKLRGEALAALNRPAEAEQALRSARDAALAQGLRPLLWRVHLSLGKLLHARGRRTEAREAFTAARSIVEELAAGILDDSLRSTFLRRADALLPKLRPVSPGRAAKERFGGLTTRERDVAVRIAEGKSNRVIAEELVVTERTVEGYVSNILGKLSFTSRAQVAAWAVEKGLNRSSK